MVRLPLLTDRLTIRMMRAEHVPALLSYRNDPDVARHQEWQLPFTEEMAQRLIDSQAELDGLVDDMFVQLAIEQDGDIVGDLAVQLYDSGHQAVLGYTIRREEQGRGYATEAAAAMLAALFADGLHRIVATIDPANGASRRVLQKLGFRYEGRALSSVLVRGEWLDDDRFALLADEYALRTASSA